jgi:Tfp pilus assembly protein PilF
VSLYRRELTRSSDDVRTMVALGTALDGAGDWQQARVEYQKALTVDPENADARFDIAHLDSKHGNYAEAEQEYRRVLLANTKDASAHNELGGVLAAVGRPADAQYEFEAAIAISPDNFDALYNLAGIEAGNNNLPRAAELLERALKQKDDADAHQLLGNVYAQSGKLADALDQFKAVQVLHPKDTVAHRQLAQLYAQMGQLGDADDWNNLGVLHARNGDIATARKDFERALTLDPQHTAARANLARL